MRKLMKQNGGRDRTRTWFGSSQPLADGCNSFILIIDCERRCRLFQPVLAGCYQDVITEHFAERAFTADASAADPVPPAR
jgi:hypothetical protein